MDIRRVVTGQDASGKSVFVSDERIAPTTVGLLPGAEFHNIWGADAPVSLPAPGQAPGAAGYFPPASGFRFLFFTVAPDTTSMPADFDIGAALAEIGEKLPGMAEVMDPTNPGMHTTDTVDFVVVMTGEVTLELDDGAEVHLKPGDSVIQNGTRHAWRNRSDRPCVLAGAIVGATRK